MPSVQIKGLKELNEAFRRYPKIAEPVLQKAIIGTQFIFQKHTLKNNPVPWRTGNLLQSFRFQHGRLLARWFPTARYAHFVEFGTRAHDIFPVSKQALAWEVGGSRGYVTAASGRKYYKKTAGRMVVVKRVRHPGTRARRYMPKIVRKATPEINKLFIQAYDIINREISKNIRFR